MTYQNNFNKLQFLIFVYHFKYTYIRYLLISCIYTESYTWGEIIGSLSNLVNCLGMVPPLMKESNLYHFPQDYLLVILCKLLSQKYLQYQMMEQYASTYECLIMLMHKSQPCDSDENTLEFLKKHYLTICLIIIKIIH